MSIDVNIANGALLKLGTNPISSPDEESERASTIRSIYNDCVDYILSQFDFKCSKKQIRLTELNTDVVFGYNKAFALPNDFIRLLIVKEGSEYSQVGNALLTNNDTCTIEYVFKNYDPTTYSPLMKELLKVRLALELSPYIKSDRTFTMSMYNEEIDKINNSANRESMQDDNEFLPEDSWVLARRI